MPQLMKIPLEQISPRWERKVDPALLKRMAQQIQERWDVEQPLVVKQVDEGKYQIIDGYLRWKAAKQTKVFGVSCYVISKDEPLEEADAWMRNWRMNWERQDRTPIETARYLRSWMESQNLTPEQLEQLIQRPRWVSKKLRLLELDPKVQDYMEEGILRESQVQSVLERLGGDASKASRVLIEMVEEDRTQEWLEQRISQLAEERDLGPCIYCGSVVRESQDHGRSEKGYYHSHCQRLSQLMPSARQYRIPASTVEKLSRMSPKKRAQIDELASKLELGVKDLVSVVDLVERGLSPEQAVQKILEAGMKLTVEVTPDVQKCLLELKQELNAESVEAAAAEAIRRYFISTGCIQK